jgi:LysM repeat protein
MKIPNIIKGLAGLVLAGSLSLNSAAQEREYLQGNVNNVKYELTTEQDFPQYKLEEHCLFDNHSCYAFWDYSPKEGELDFWISDKNEESMTFQNGRQVKIDAPKYIPTKVGEIANIRNLAIEKTSFEELKKRAKEKQYFGFSVDITDEDLRFALPELVIKGTPYIVLREVLDNSSEQIDLPYYLIPKTEGTKIFFPSQAFLEINKDAFPATITCDKQGGVFQPIFKVEDYKSSPTQISIENTSNQEKKEEWQGNTEKTPYMKHLEEQEKQEQKSNTLEKKVTQTLQKTQAKTEKKDTCTYTVKKGDTFYSLATIFYGNEKDVDKIQGLNPDVNPEKLKIGQKLKVPCK